MALTDADRQLLDRLLQKKPGAWNSFAERYLGLIYQVIHYTSHLRSVPLSPEDVEDVASEVMLRIVDDDYKVLREFRRESSLTTYLTVITRRICIGQLTKRAARPERPSVDGKSPEPADPRPTPITNVEDKEEVARLLKRLPARERQVVRMFHLEGRSYEEIATALHIPVNSIGPILSRAMTKMRDGKPPATPPKPGNLPPVRKQAASKPTNPPHA